jgi:hypothetical protein
VACVYRSVHPHLRRKGKDMNLGMLSSQQRYPHFRPSNAIVFNRLERTRSCFAPPPSPLRESRMGLLARRLAVDNKR